MPGPPVSHFGVTGPDRGHGPNAPAAFPECLRGHSAMRTIRQIARPIFPIDEVTVDRRGHRMADTMLAIDERNRWLAEAASRFLPDHSSRAAAHRLHVALARYRDGAWRRECTAEAVSLRRRGRLE